MHTSRLLALIGAFSCICITKILAENLEIINDIFSGSVEDHKSGNKNENTDRQDDYRKNEIENMESNWKIDENEEKIPKNEASYPGNEEEIPENKEEYLRNEIVLDDDESYAIMMAYINDTEGKGFIGDSDEGFIEFTNNTKQATMLRSLVPEIINLKTSTDINPENEDYKSENEIPQDQNDYREDEQIYKENYWKIPENKASYPGNEEEISEDKKEYTKKDSEILINEEENPVNGEEIQESKEDYQENEKVLDDDESYMYINDIEGKGFIGGSDEGFIEFTYNTKQATESRSLVPETIHVKTDKLILQNDIYGKDNTYENAIYYPPDPDYTKFFFVIGKNLTLKHAVEDIHYFVCFCEGGLVERQLPRECILQIFHALKQVPKCKQDAVFLTGLSLDLGLQTCSRCQAAIKECLLDEPSKLYKCTEKRINYIRDFNEEIKYAMIEPFELDQRQIFIEGRRRAPGQSCFVTARYKYVYVKCKDDSKYIKCQQRCYFGYTFKGGDTERTSFCNYNEDKWRPYEIQSCLPTPDIFPERGDIHDTIEESGSCSERTSYIPAYCNPFSDGIQDVFEPVKKTVVCPIDGKGENADLPDCVSPYLSGHLSQPEPKDLTFPVEDIFEEEKKRNALDEL